MGFFQIFLGFFRVSSFFEFFGFLSGFGVFFWVRVHLRVKNETHTQTRFCAGQVRITGVKMYLNPHMSGAKPAGYPKPEPELSSLILNLDSLSWQKIRADGKFLKTHDATEKHHSFVGIFKFVGMDECI
jgi:hypothetical protein